MGELNGRKKLLPLCCHPTLRLSNKPVSRAVFYRSRRVACGVAGPLHQWRQGLLDTSVSLPSGRPTRRRRCRSVRRLSHRTHSYLQKQVGAGPPPQPPPPPHISIGGVWCRFGRLWCRAGRRAAGCFVGPHPLRGRILLGRRPGTRRAQEAAGPIKARHSARRRMGRVGDGGDRDWADGQCVCAALNQGSESSC